MDIKCKSSRRFLFKIDTDNFYNTIDSLLKTKVEVPLIIEVPCKKCGLKCMKFIETIIYIKKAIKDK